MYFSHTWRSWRPGHAAVAIWAALWMAGQAEGQTKIHLPTQASAADYAQFSFTRPVKLSTVLSGSCLTGELLFKTDSPAGTNLHLCSNSVWYALNTATGGMSDLKVSATTTAVSVEAGRFRYMDSTGRYAVTEIAGATLTRVAGSDGGILRLEVDDGGGTPVVRCLYGAGLNSSNYTASGCVGVSQDYFSVGAQALATVSISGGVWGTPVDLRAMGGTVNYLAGMGLVRTGNMFSINPAILPFLGNANTWAGKQTMSPGASEAGFNVGSMTGDPLSPLNGDIWYNASSGKFRCRQNGVTADCIAEAVSPGGVDTQIQFHDGGAFGGDAGLTWDKTLKSLTVAKSGSGALITAQATNSAVVNDVASVQACLNNDSNNCAGLRHSFTNLNGAGNAYWAGLIHRSGSENYPVVARSNGGEVHVGGSSGNDPMGSGPGWMVVTAGGVTRFGAQATAGLGLAPILGVWETSGATGDIGAQSLLGSGHTAGVYRVCGTVSVTTAEAGAFTVWTLNWRDVSSGTDLSRKMAFDDDGTVTTTPSRSAPGALSVVCKVIRSTGASAITVDPGDAGGAIYNAAFSLERLQ